MHKKQGGNDPGARPAVINIYGAACGNTNFRSVRWTGEHLQLTVMSIPCGGEVGIEMHDHVDQLVRVEHGTAAVYLGTSPDALQSAGIAGVGCAVFVPAGTWHNIVNNGRTALKLSSIYAPPQHPLGAVNATKAASDAAH